ncbi:MAG: hypothetical protein RLZZ272_1215 [Actinomycetota bacterium]
MSTPSSSEGVDRDGAPEQDEAVAATERSHPDAPDGPALGDAGAALARELATIDDLAPRERATLLERVRQHVDDELAALDGL